MNSMERLLKKVTLHTHRPKRAETRSFPSKAAGNEDPDVYWTSTLKGWSDRERSWGPFSAAEWLGGYSKSRIALLEGRCSAGCSKRLSSAAAASEEARRICFTRPPESATGSFPLAVR